MYIMTDRGWMPLWTLDPVTPQKMEFVDLLAPFTLEERSEIDSARRDYTANEHAKILGLREAFDARRQPKTVVLAVAKGPHHRRLYLGGNGEAAMWFATSTNADWWEPDQMSQSWRDAIGVSEGYIVAREVN